jgi:hypothetical protein
MSATYYFKYVPATYLQIRTGYVYCSWIEFQAGTLNPRERNNGTQLRSLAAAG